MYFLSSFILDIRFALSLAAFLPNDLTQFDDSGDGRDEANLEEEEDNAQPKITYNILDG